VLAGLADVGNVDEYVWVEYLKQHPEVGRQLKVIERFGAYPFTPIVAGRSVPSAEIKRMQEVLVRMRDDAEGRAILDAFGRDGFVVRDAAFFDPIAKMQEAVSAAHRP